MPRVDAAALQRDALADYLRSLNEPPCTVALSHIDDYAKCRRLLQLLALG
jgi:hypothetical protein